MAWTNDKTMPKSTKPTAKTAAPKSGPYFSYSLGMDAAFRKAAGVTLEKGVVGEVAGQTMIYKAAAPGFDGRIAGIEAGTGSVLGLLFDVPAAAWPKVIAMESALNAQPVTVKVKAEGKTVEATTFVPVGKPGDLKLPVSESFLSKLTAAASSLPEVYRTKLQAEAMIVERVQKFGREKHLG